MTEAYTKTSPLTLTPWELEHGQMQRQDVDLISPYIEQPRHEAMIEAMRREGRVVFYEYNGDPGYNGFWVVTGNEDARLVLADANRYSSYGTKDRGGLMIHDLPPGFDMARELMIMQDGSPHHEQRKLVEKDFRKTAIAKLSDYLTSRANELITRAMEADEVDIVQAVAAPLPLDAIVKILDIPKDVRDVFYELGANISLVETPPGGDVDASSIGSVLGLVEEARKLRHRVKSGEIASEFLGKLNQAVHERVITPFQFQMFFVLLFQAGNETTRNTLAHGVVALAKNPEQLRLLKANPELLDSAADEMIRWASAVRYTRRTALEDGMVGDAPVAAGDKVVVYFAGANRDPQVFERPHEFDITRDNRRMLSFGHGPHSCLGRHLAKLEVGTALKPVVENVERIELLEEPKHEPSTQINKLGTVAVKLHAA